MRVVTKRKPSKAKAPPLSDKPFIVLSEDRPPAAHDNPRHVVLIAEANGVPRKVVVRNPGDAEVNVGGNVYKHASEDTDGKWVYTRG